VVKEELGFGGLPAKDGPVGIQLFCRALPEHRKKHGTFRPAMLFLSGPKRKEHGKMHSRMLVLRFSKDIVDQPIIANLVRDFNLSFNILKAQIFPRKEGMLVMELRGIKRDFEKGIRYLENLGVDIEPVGQGIRRDDDKCYQCGACTAVCPTGALHVNRPDMHVLFESERCSACELCVKTCPVRAMIVTFDKTLA
jgi:ferredoxin